MNDSFGLAQIKPEGYVINYGGGEPFKCRRKVFESRVFWKERRKSRMPRIWRWLNET